MSCKFNLDNLHLYLVIEFITQTTDSAYIVTVAFCVVVKGFRVVNRVNNLSPYPALYGNFRNVAESLGTFLNLSESLGILEP